MSLPVTAPLELRETASRYQAFSVAHAFKAASYRNPLYQPARTGEIVLNRHITTTVRGVVLRGGFQDNGTVASVLSALEIPHAQTGSYENFDETFHPELFAAFRGLRKKLHREKVDRAVGNFLRSVDKLTPDARDDHERQSLAEELLQAAGVSLEFSSEGQVHIDGAEDIPNPLTPTPLLVSTPAPLWPLSPYGLVDIPRNRAYTTPQ